MDKKILVSIACITISMMGMEENVSNSLAIMEKNDSPSKFMLERKSSNPLNIVKQQASILTLDESPSIHTPPTSYLQSISYVTAVVSNSFESIKNTVNNRLWDESAFKKLGWPPSDKEAKKELKATLKIYKRVEEYFCTGIMYEKFPEDYEAIKRRECYCQRVLEALPQYSDAVNLALFCLEKHQFAMCYCDFKRFKLFLDLEQKKSTQTAEKVKERLAKLTYLHKSEKDSEKDSEQKKDEQK
ncbi:MAG TPA: hypothetical protein VKU36_00775 [Candidatus Babeliales bacterium]|nr:hypothetical protein [Candidatus Babeliales bacterium]